MAILNWSQSYSVGVAMFDAEHRHLFQLLNQLYDAILDGSVNNAKTSLILGQVLEFSIQHCDHEEEMMAKAGYPDMAHLQQEHEHLRQTLKGYRRKLISGSGIANELASFLMEWVLSHIMKEDKKCGAFLNAAGIH